MTCRILAILVLVMLAMGSPAQTNRKIRSLQSKRTELQNQINKSEQMLLTMKKDVKSQLGDLAVLNTQIGQQTKLLKSIEEDLGTIDTEILRVESRLDTLMRNLDEKRLNYDISMRYAFRQSRSIQDRLMFILKGKSLVQMYRRMRYAREYATYIKVQGEEIKSQQKEVQRQKEELLEAKAEKSSLLSQNEAQKKKLEDQQKKKQNLVTSLQKKQKTVQQEVASKRKQSEKLNREIDRLIEQEIAAAKKREEEKRRRQEEARKKSGRSSSSKGATASSGTSSTTSPARRDVEKMDTYSPNNMVAGGFERNKGRLPMPITGSYVVVGHYGSHAVSGLKNVQLDNKGIDIKGQAGAQARSIFEGEVSAVFSYGGTQGVLVRHGKYISVYCNLASVSVSQGQTVKQGTTIGKVASSEDGYILHFQLRHETTKLNPEAWVR